jgi:hypothetical protein
MSRYVVIPAILALTAGMSVLGYFVGENTGEPIPAAIGLGLLTLFVGGGAYLVHYTRSMNKTTLPKQELEEGEVVWAKTHQSMVHFRTGSALKFWEAVGGRLFLTNQVLEFRSFPAEFFVYRLTIPLEQIVHAESYRLFGLIPGALRVWRRDGSFELFTFGAAFDMSAEWADAILDFRDDLREVTHEKT